MLEAKLEYSGIQAKGFKKGIEPLPHKQCPENEPVNKDLLLRTADYVVVKHLYRDGKYYGQLFAAANEIEPCLSADFEMGMDSIRAAKYLVNFYEAFKRDFVVKKRELLADLHLYYHPSFLKESKEDREYRKALNRCGEVAIVINEAEPSNVFEFQEFHHLLDSGSIQGHIPYFDIWLDSLGRLGFDLENNHLQGHIVSGANFTPILPQLLEMTDLTPEERQQFIGFVEKLASRQGFELDQIVKKIM